jgi:hypothetical protein
MPRASTDKRGIHLVGRQNGNSEQKQDALNRKSSKTGEVVPHSGIYRVSHSEHRLPHEVTLLRGDSFPPCSKCDVGVKFKMLRGVALDSFKIVLNSLPEIDTKTIAAADDLEQTA